MKFPAHDFVQRVPRPKPDKTVLPELKYLPYDKTLNTTDEGHPREVDDFQPRAQIRKRVKNGTLSLSDGDKIASFSEDFAVEEEYVRNYLEHLQHLELKKLKRKEETRKNKEAQSQLSCNDYDWDDMHRKGTLKKKPVKVLDIFLERHKLENKTMKKENKRLLINAWLAKAQLKNAEKIDTQEYDEDPEKSKEYENSELEEYEIDTIAGIKTDVPVNEDENTDVVLQEIGFSSDE